jgi:hypothetical protein
MADALFGEADDLDGIVNELHKTPGWPVDESKDRALVRDLLDRYPQLDLVEEVRKWRDWMLDHESRKKVRHRARFGTWCSKAVTYGRAPGRLGRSGPGDIRRVSAARTADAHGATSGELEHW